MFGRERELRRLFTEIAIAMLFFILFINVYSIFRYGQELVLYWFPRIVWLECLTDIVCSLIYFLSFLLPALIFHRLSQDKHTIVIKFGGEIPLSHSFWKTIAIFFVSLGAIIVMSYLNSWLLPPVSSVGEGMKMSRPYQVVLLVFSSAIVPAFCEELLFRGTILSALKPYGKGMAIIVSSLLFGLMHMNAAQLLYATAAGLVLGLVYVKTNSLLLCILIHFSNNMFNILESYRYEIFGSQTAWKICLLAELVIFFVGILAILIYACGKKNEQMPEKIGVFGENKSLSFDTPMEGHRVVKQFFCPMMIVYITAVLLNIVYLWYDKYLAR